MFKDLRVFFWFIPWSTTTIINYLRLFTPLISKEYWSGDLRLKSFLKNLRKVMNQLT
jgi:hypothetical protein